MHELASGLVVVQKAMTELGCDQTISIRHQKAELMQLSRAEGQVSIVRVRVEAIVVGRFKEQQKLLLEQDDDVLAIHDRGGRFSPMSFNNRAGLFRFDNLDRDEIANSQLSVSGPSNVFALSVAAISRQSTHMETEIAPLGPTG